MTTFDLTDYSWGARIFWCMLIVAAVAVLGLSAFSAAEFSFGQHFALGVALIISVLINQHTIRVPDTKLEFSSRELVSFWGTIWLGAPAGIMLAASASLARFGKSGRDKKAWAFGVASNVLSSFLSSAVFYFSLSYFAGFTEKAVGGNVFIADKVILSAGLMALAHYLLDSIFTVLFSRLSRDYVASRQMKQGFAGKIVSYSLSLATTVLFYYAFIRFGIEFGLVLLPIAVVGNLAYSIHLRRLAQKTREITDASRIHLATVEALATAIDARDQVGIGHVRRAQIYAIGMGQILGLDEEDIDALRTGALLHDIGKLAVPDHILNKPGRLTPAELEKTKIHSSVGASILEKVGFMTPVVPTVKYHHEHWDGTGYPEHLAGEDIPLTARILAVADAYDTLRGARPYRPAVSRDEARRYLINGAGSQFDPKIVDIFLRNLRTFEHEVVEQGLSYVFDLDKTDEPITADDGGSQSYVEQIKRANREVFTLYELARVFSSSLNLNETLSLFAKKISDFVPYDTCMIFLMEESQQSAEAVFVKGKNSAALKDKKVNLGEGATGYVLKKQLPVRNIKPGLDFSFAPMDFVQEYKSMASLPLIAGEKFLGAVSLYSCDLETYEEEHLRILETVTRIAADAIWKSLQHAETESHALTDPMTGLPNARSLQSQFEKEVARSNRSESSFQVLMLDLDGFKAVNDTFGHKTGDALLREISAVMRAQLRDYDFLARYAGDEFVAIIPDTTKEGVEDLCVRLEKAVGEFKLPIDSSRYAQVGVSLGAASYPQSGRTFDQVVIAADKAMYAEKSARKQRLVKQLSAEAVLEVVEAIEINRVDEGAVIQAVPEVHMTAEPVHEDGFIVELDESHVVSGAIN